MTEIKVMTLLRPAQEFVNGWKKLGGRFALEQFGSGLNSFQLLNHIHADYLKIDRSYMADLPQHPDSQKQIAELCQQARELNRQTKIGRAHVCTQVTNAHILCRLLLE